MNQNERFNFLAPVYELMHLGARRTAKKLLELGGFQKTDKMLDLGGGVGRIAKRLAPYVSEIIVADVAEGMIKQCEKNNSIKCVLLTDRALSFPNEYFDKIIIVDAFHHFEKQEESILQVKRVLKKGGVVVLDEINPKSLFGRFVALTENIFGVTHMFLAPYVLERMWQKHGFTTKLHNENRGSYYLYAKKHSIR